jgi:predicted site-specific integrase-resolvase
MNIEKERSVDFRSINSIYDTTSLAKSMGISREMIYYYKRKGKLKGFSISKNKELYTKEQIIEFLTNEGYKITNYED